MAHDFTYTDGEEASAEASVLTVTYSILRREVGRFLGYGRDPTAWTGGSDEAVDVEDILRSGVRRVLTPPPLPGEKKAHEWSFLRPVATFATTTPYETGTVTIASGVVTLAGGTWPTWATQGMLTVAGATYAVASRTDGTTIALVDTSVSAAAGTDYSLGRAFYDLPTDFADIDGPLTYAAGQSILRTRVDRISAHQLLELTASVVTPGCPRLFAIRPKAIDMSEATTYEMLLSPTPDAVYTLYYNYRVAIPALDGSTNTTPPGGDSHGELYLEACLAAAEQKLHDAQGLHSARFMECLIASVSHDREVSCPETLGMNTDHSDSPIDWDDHRFTNTGLTRYNGVYPP
jgi:hypothetical protein